MVTDKQFLSDFTRDLVEQPGERPTLIAGYASLMESRRLAAVREELEELVLAILMSTDPETPALRIVTQRISDLGKEAKSNE